MRPAGSERVPAGPVPAARTDSSSSSLAYRPGLDGLRGLAVVAVLLYHADVPAVRGGFLGVDVFFVLSGFLITSILIAEWQRWGSIDLRTFYLHRARRLLPGLLLVLAAVSGWAALGPAERRGPLREDLLSTLGYVANWHFVTSGDSYFDRFTTPSPLLHTWSLGIEEQWYLVFPILLIAALSLLRVTGVMSSRDRILVTSGLLALACGSAVLMAVLDAGGADPSRSYYGTDTRAQELLVGAALAVATNAGRSGWPRRMVRHVGPAALAILVVLMATVPDRAPWMYRGGFLLIAMLTALVVLDATRRSGVTSQLLGSRWPRAVGLVSYGLYLWHWPVFVYLDTARTGWDGAGLLVARLATTAVLAALSYRFVEQPIRRGALGLRFGRRRVGRLGLVLAGVFVVAVVGATAGARPDTADQFRRAAPVVAQLPGQPVVYLVGDSVPYNLRLYAPSSKDTGFAVDGSTALGCGLIPAARFVDGVQRPLADVCRAWSDRWPDEAATRRPAMGVVFPGIGEQFDQQDEGHLVAFGSAAFRAHLDRWFDRSVTALRSAGARRVAMVTVPCHRVPGGAEGDIVNDLTRLDWLNAEIRRYGQQTQLPVLDLAGFLCADGYTDDVDGTRLHTDGLHFTEQGAAVIWAWLVPRIARLLPPRR